MNDNELIVPVHLFSVNNQSYSICLAEDVKTFVITKDEESSKIYLMLEEVTRTLLKEREEHNRALEKIKKEYEELALKLEKEHNRALEEYSSAIAENKQYKEWYGTLISPILIITELWNNGEKGELDMLVPPTRWSVGAGLHGENGKRAKRYWLSTFQEWQIIKMWGKGKYMSNVGMYEALEILNQMMKKQNIIKLEKEVLDEK